MTSSIAYKNYVKFAYAPATFDQFMEMLKSTNEANTMTIRWKTVRTPIHRTTHNMYWGKVFSADGGKIAGNKQYENGLGMFSLSKEERIKAGIKGMEISNSIQRTCPYCLKTIKGPNYGKWHGEKCKLKNKKI